MRKNKEDSVSGTGYSMLDGTFALVIGDKINHLLILKYSRIQFYELF